MKTFADIKRRATAGTRLEVLAQTKRPVLVGTIRTVTNPRSLSTRSYEFTSDHTGDETYVGTWPKASEVRIIDADTFEYDLHPGPGVIRLRFLPAEPATTDIEQKSYQYPSIEAFYNERPERRTSGESDYGVHWHADGRNWPLWRVSYVQATGEVYAVENGHCKVRVLGVIPPDPDERYRKDRPGGIAWSDRHDCGTYYRTLDKILDGWADPDVTGHDLAWVVQRLQEHELREAESAVVRGEMLTARQRDVLQQDNDRLTVQAREQFLAQHGRTSQ